MDLESSLSLVKVGLFEQLKNDWAWKLYKVDVLLSSITNNRIKVYGKIKSLIKINYKLYEIFLMDVDDTCSFKVNEPLGCDVVSNTPHTWF